MTHRSSKHEHSAGESLVRNMVRTRIPTRHGEFMLHYYENKRENKEHLALVKGDVEGALDVPVRVHSECLTGDVFGSMRCDCGDQLDRALRIIGSGECGVLLYLRQEGRGIGLLKKLQAYNLQDEGLDTVEANLRLGHREDERDYDIAAAILKDLKLHSVRLITNNPRKIGELRELGVDVTDRIPIEIPFNAENEGYLRTKARKMQHLLSLKLKEGESGEFVFLEPLLECLARHQPGAARPFVTLGYAQNLIGGIPSSPPHSARALRLKRFLHGRHDALLLGVDTVLDESRFKADFLAEVQLVIVDENLHLPADSKWLETAAKKPIIVTAEAESERSARLAAQGVKILSVGRHEGVMDMQAALKGLAQLGLNSLMVDGDGAMIAALLSRQLVDYCVITMIPELAGGLKPTQEAGRLTASPQLFIGDCHYHALDNDIIIHGALASS